MNNHTFYVLGVIVIVTGVLGIITGALVGTPGSIVIGAGLVVASVWMMTKLHEQEKTNRNV